MKNNTTEFSSVPKPLQRPTLLKKVARLHIIGAQNVRLSSKAWLLCISKWILEHVTKWRRQMFMKTFKRSDHFFSNSARSRTNLILLSSSHLMINHSMDKSSNSSSIIFKHHVSAAPSEFSLEKYSAVQGHAQNNSNMYIRNFCSHGKFEG
jgi:hypothetical protein